MVRLRRQLIRKKSHFRCGGSCTGLRSRFVCSVVLFAVSGAAFAQTNPMPKPPALATPGLSEKTDISGFGQNVLGISIGKDTPRSPNEKPGTPFAEILRGNGTRAGYVLS